MIEKEKIGQLVDLRIEYLKGLYDGMSSEEEVILRKNTEAYISEYWNKECFPFLIEVNGESVSCAILRIVREIPTRKNPRGIYAILNGVYTRPEYRNRGYATALVGACIALAAGKDAAYVDLFTLPEGKSIYEKFGFKYHEIGYPRMRYKL